MRLRLGLRLGLGLGLGFGLGSGLGFEFGFAVAHLALVQVGDALRDLERQPREQLRRERRGRAVGVAGAGVGALLVQQLVERAAGEVLEDDGGEALLHARAKEGADRAVAQLA